MAIVHQNPNRRGQTRHASPLFSLSPVGLTKTIIAIGKGHTLHERHKGLAKLERYLEARQAPVSYELRFPSADPNDPDSERVLMTTVPEDAYGRLRIQAHRYQVSISARPAAI